VRDVVEAQRGTPYVIAVDAGGTHTRVGCFGAGGELLATGTGRGGSADHDDQAARNVAGAVSDALEAGHLDPADALALAAGTAGVSRPGSNQGNRPSEWAHSFYALPWLSCPRVFVNDAVVAHRGALLGGAGVIVVAGTGSMVLLIDGDGVQVESGQFEHYAGGARHLVFDVVHQVLAGTATAQDASLVAAVLDHWGVEDLDGLRRALLALADVDRNEVKRRYGALAPVVTAAAGTSPLADRALRALTDKTACGVLLLAPLAGVDPVPVAVTGALASAPAFTQRLRGSLAVPGATPTRLVPSALGPLGGAALLAYDLAGTGAGPEVVDRLTRDDVSAAHERT
jgi:glucosamine kinase